MKGFIVFIVTMLLVTGINATNIKNTNVTTSAGVLNVSVEQYTNGIYDI